MWFRINLKLASTTQDTIIQARKVLQNPSMAEETANYNFELARHYFSYSVLERRLNTILAEISGEQEISRGQ